MSSSNPSITDNSDRARYAVNASRLLLPGSLAGILLEGYHWLYLGDHGSHNMNVEENYTNGIHILIAIQLPLGIVCTFLLLSWMYRAYSNLHGLRSPKLRFSKSAAVWSWFLPVVNLFVPPQIMSDIWKRTPRCCNPEFTETENKEEESPVRSWWALQISALAVPIAGIYFFARTAKTGLDLYKMTSLFLLIGSLISFCALFSLISLIKKIAKSESGLFDRVEKQLKDGSFEFDAGTTEGN